MTRPVKNLLFIVADQWRGDTLGARGHACVQTPHLDALAADGVAFASHFGQASPCGPARASMLTGLYMMNHRQVGNGTPLAARFPNLALEAAKAGLEAALFGYTDTPLDPGLRDAATSLAEAWICPGFSPVAPFLFADGFAAWTAALRAKGYAIPERPIDIYGPAEGTDPKTYPPSRLRAEDTDTAYLTDAALDHIAAKGDQPWFVHLACLRPHPPMFAPEPYNSLHDPAAAPAPRRPADPRDIKRQHPYLAWAIETQSYREYFHRRLAPAEITDDNDRRMRAVYYGNCSEVDAQIGRLIAHLKAAGAYDDTLIVFTSDHGEQFGDNWLYGRRGPYDGHFHLPLIIRDPRPAADAARGATVDAFTEAVDLMPTMLAALGRAAPPGLDGASLVPFLHGATPAGWRQAVFYELDFRDTPRRRIEAALGLASAECQLAVLRDRDYKYVHFAGLAPLLFDLRADPAEQHDLARDPAHAALLWRYAEAMLSRRMSSADRALTGFHQPYDGDLQELSRGP